VSFPLRQYCPFYRPRGDATFFTVNVITGIYRGYRGIAEFHTIASHTGVNKKGRFVFQLQPNVTFCLRLSTRVFIAFAQLSETRLFSRRPTSADMLPLSMIISVEMKQSKI